MSSEDGSDGEDAYGDSFDSESESQVGLGSPKGSSRSRIDVNAYDPTTDTLRGDAGSPDYSEYVSTGAQRKGRIEKVAKVETVEKIQKNAEMSSRQYHDEDASEKVREQKELIEKLQIANAALRQQLKEFGRALEVSLQTAGARKAVGSSSSPSEVGASGDVRAKLDRKVRHIASLKKKVSVLKAGNKHLKEQLRRAYNTSKISELNNELKMREGEIKDLVKKNKSLKSQYRAHTKEMERQEEDRKMWPRQIASLNEELRVAHERLRAMRDKRRKEEALHKKQRAEMMTLLDKNRELKEQLSSAMQSSAHKKEKEKREKLKEEMQKSAKEKEKMIAILQKRYETEKKKTAAVTRKCKEKVEKAKRRMQDMEKLVKEKEKEIRMQVVSVKKLKRHLKGFLSVEGGGGDLGVGDAPWAANIAEYNALRNVEGEEADAEIVRKVEKQPSPPKRAAAPVPESVVSDSSSVASSEPGPEPELELEPAPKPEPEPAPQPQHQAKAEPEAEFRARPAAAPKADPPEKTAFAKPAGVRKKKKSYF